MKTAYLGIIAIALLVGWSVSCREGEEGELARTTGLVGRWRYVERGYSPGAGYYVDPIPPIPMRTLTFTASGAVSTVNMTEAPFNQARYYRLDSTRSAVYLTFTDAARQPLAPGVYVSIRNDTLRLSPQCFEGCHYGFVRMP